MRTEVLANNMRPAWSLSKNPCALQYREKQEVPLLWARPYYPGSKISEGYLISTNMDDTFQNGLIASPLTYISLAKKTKKLLGLLEVVD